MNQRKIYRIENPISESGMWYDKHGNFNPVINQICPKGICRYMPMDYNPEHKKDGKDWYSAGKSIENMQDWFSAEDACLLIKNGYGLYELTITEYQENELEILFTKESVINVKNIPISDIWDIQI